MTSTAVTLPCCSEDVLIHFYSIEIHKDIKRYSGVPKGV